MYTTKTLKHEIDAAVDELMQQNMEIRPGMIAIKIIHSHYGEAVKETDGLMECCMFRYLREQVGRMVACMKREEKEVTTQKDMFAHLQQYYVVERHGEDVGIPRMQMTTAERRRKADELRAEAQAKMSHAQALDRETDLLINKGVLEPDMAA